MITEEDIVKVMVSAADFPALSASATQIAEMTSDIQAPVSKVAKLIMMDVGLSTKLLRVVNSSFYGLSGPVSEIAQAIGILGYKKVGSLALGLAMMDTFSLPPASTFNLSLFWERSVCNAVAAGVVSARLRRNFPGEIFTAGLLQDIGTLFLGLYLPTEYEASLSTVQAIGGHPAKVERSVIGLDHASVGAVLVRQWKLPAIFEKTIREHHFYELDTDISSSPTADMFRVVNLSNLVTDVFYEEDKDARLALLIDRAQKLFGLGEKGVEAILEQVPEEMEAAATTFQLTVRLKRPVKGTGGGGEVLSSCPRCGAKGLGKFCVECGACLVQVPGNRVNRSILIAEDSVATRRALAFVLKKMNYEVLEAVNGAEAVDLARRHQPGLIMLDIMMPVLTGIEVVKILRSETATNVTPIIMLTSLTDSTTVVEAVQSGANDYILKPYTADTIVDRVQKYMAMPLSLSR